MSEKENETGLATRLFQGAKDLVWEKDPRAKRAQASTPAVAQNKPDALATNIATLPRNRNAITSSGTSTSTSTSTASNPMSAELLTVVMNRPTAYSALAEAIAALADIPMDEATRYRSAFAVLKKTQQRTVEQIAQAVEVHLGVLEEEINRFKGQSKHVENDEVTARSAEITALNQALEQGGEQIARLREDTDARIRALQDDLSKKQTRARELAREAEEKQRVINEMTQNFAAASEIVKDSLQREKSKLQQYLS